MGSDIRACDRVCYPKFFRGPPSERLFAAPDLHVYLVCTVTPTVSTLSQTCRRGRFICHQGVTCQR